MSAADRAALFGGSNIKPAPGGGPKKKKTIDEVLKEGEWVEKKDERSGKSYYYNKKSKQTTWDLVKELGLDPTSSSSPSSGGAGGGSGKKTVADVLKEGLWVEKKDDRTGKTYYYNKETKKTTWDLAKELGLDSAGGSSTSGKKTVADVLKEGLWVEKKDDRTGKTYYYNKETKKTTWDLAKELGLDSAAAAGGSSSGKKTVADVLKEGVWVEKKDDRTGKIYYYNKQTRKTTWDLVKELDLEDPNQQPAAAAEEPPAAAAEQQPEKKVYDGPPKSVEEALERGEWIERRDPRSGKKFYVNIETKATTWNLAKTLGLTTAEEDDEEEERLKKPPTAAELLEQGIWKQVKDYRGLPYFIKTSTGEACADLELYLKIRSELSSGPSKAARQDAAIGIPQMKEWVDFFTQNREADTAEKRLLSDVTKKEVDDARRVVAEAKHTEDVLKRQLQMRDQEITNLRSLLSMQGREVQQLQSALFYGMGGNAYSAAVTQSAADSAGTTGNQPAKLLLPPPSLDVTIARDENHPENVARRIATLERLVFDLQGQNRQLLEQLQTVTDTKHRHAECSVCFEHDPWQRLLSVAHQPTAAAGAPPSPGNNNIKQLQYGGGGSPVRGIRQ